MARELPNAPPGMTRDRALALVEAHARASQAELAGRTDAGADVLTYLSENGAAATRRAVAANPAAPAAANRHLAGDEDDDVRAELARKIARLMPGLAREENAHVREITIATLEMLAADQVARIRAILADEIKHLDCVPKAIVKMLAHDTDTLVAAPVLEYSPLLSDADLMEIVAAAKAGEILAAIARRKPLAAPVADALVSTLDIPAIATLLANPDATIRQKTLDDIAEQAEKIQSLHAPLVLRADLSRRAINRIATFVSASLIDQLLTRYKLDVDLSAILNKQLRLRLQEEGRLETSTHENAARAVADARAAGKLDDNFVEMAANASQRDVVMLALAELANVPEETVRKIFASHLAKPVTALVWRAGLHMRTAFKIQSFVMKLAVGELLPARAGVHFPMTEDEMRWHLSYFNVV